MAGKCGLSQTEYIRQRALGYEPKMALPDEFFKLGEKLDKLIEKDDSEELRALSEELLREMLIVLKPSKEEVSKWQPQASGR